MKISLIVVGKTKDNALTGWIEDYAKRIKKFTSFEIVLVKESSQLSDWNLQLQKESENLLKVIKPTDFVILLDEKGKTFSSEKFAAKITELQHKNTKHLVFIIGGAYGFDKTVYERANDKLALSEMTFTHQMVRVIFTEQLYRAFTIINKLPYHH